MLPLLSKNSENKFPNSVPRTIKPGLNMVYVKREQLMLVSRYPIF